MGEDFKTAIGAESIFPDLKQFSDFRVHNPGIKLSAYAWMTLTPDLLVATMDLLWPRFVRVDRRVYFADGFSSDNLRDWLSQLDGDHRAAQMMMNHRHVGAIVLLKEDASAELIQFIGSTISHFWRASIRHQFPDVIPIVCSEWEKDDPYDVIVNVYQDQI